MFFIALHERMQGKFFHTSLQPLNSFVQRIWNERNQVPMENWLLKADERGSDDDKRLRTRACLLQSCFSGCIGSMKAA